MAKSTKPEKYKSDFILEHPNLKAKDVVAQGKAAGFTLTEKYVYTIRSLARSRKEEGEARRAVAASGAGTGAAGLLLAVAAEVGLGRAIELLQAERRRVVTMLGR